jgi:hypothetical protein
MNCPTPKFNLGDWVRVKDHGDAKIIGRGWNIIFQNWSYIVDICDGQPPDELEWLNSYHISDSISFLPQIRDNQGYYLSTSERDLTLLVVNNVTADEERGGLSFL